MKQSPKIPPSFDKIPCPFHYAAFFNSLDNDPHWEAVQGFQNLRPGDILCYLPPEYTPEPISEMPQGRTGMHVGVIEKIKMVGDSTIELDLIDSTRKPHCKEDSRYKEGKGGIGRAPLKISRKEDTADMPFSLQWGSSQTKWEKKLFFGRVKNFENPQEYLQCLKNVLEKLQCKERPRNSIDVVQSSDNLTELSDNFELPLELLQSLESCLEKLHCKESPRNPIGVVQSSENLTKISENFELPLEIFQSLESRFQKLQSGENSQSPVGDVTSE